MCIVHNSNIIANKMKRSSMKIPPLSQLYEQKIDFSAHKRKLEKIMSDRKAHLQRDCDNKTQESIVRRNLNHYSLKHNAKSLEIAKENSKIMKKIETIKPAYGFRQSLSISDRSQVKSSHMINSRSRVVQQQRQNFRLRQRVQSMNSSLNNKKLLQDYRRSMQIKKRITHFKTEENRVVLKAEKYLGGAKATAKSDHMFLRIVDPEGLPDIHQHSEGRELVEKKLNKNIANYYNKEDILKNKVKINNKLFKFAREKRLKTLLLQQTTKEQHPIPNKKSSNNSAFFPTQPPK